MCGIAGLIGESKMPEASFDLITEIVRNLERRGEDSTGFWGTQKGSKGAITYHKEPQKSSLFVDKPVWKSNQKFNPNLMITHARAASPGVGGPSDNMNNHPFVSEDKTLGVVHNGKLPEYKFLQTKYDHTTNCDSELVLRILTSKNDLPLGLKDNKNITEFQKNRISGIRKLWSLSTFAHMAIAVGEWFDDGTRHLWLFRNKERPLWVSDMRSTLGQVFFFSEPSIWYDAVKAVPYLESYITEKNKMYEMPTEEIWFFQIDKDHTYVTKEFFQKFKIVKNKTHTCQDKDVKEGIPFEIKKNKPSKVICHLDEKEEVIKPKSNFSSNTNKSGTTTGRKPFNANANSNNSKNNSTYSFNSSGKKTSPPDNEEYFSNVKAHEAGKKKEEGISITATVDEEEGFYNDQFDRNDILYGTHGHGMQLVETYDYSSSVEHANVSKLCDEIKSIVSNIDVNFTNQSIENGVSENEYAELLDSLETIKGDLTSTQHLLDSKRSSL